MTMNDIGLKASIEAVEAKVDTVDGVVDGIAASAEWSDSGFVSTGAQDFNAGEIDAFTISKDVRYEMKDAFFDISGFTSTATITFNIYKATAAAGASYDIVETFTKVVDTDPNLVPIPDRVHFGYMKVGVQSDNAGDTAVDASYGWTVVERE